MKTRERWIVNGGPTMRFAAIVLIAVHGALSTVHASRAEIRNGQFYVDGEPFYVRGVGYAPWRPHQHPGVSYADTNRRWTERDFERMKNAHFNTVRTWDALAPEELELARKYGLMILQGIRLDPRQDFSDPHNQDSAVAQVQSIAQQSKEADNILGYIIMTEPSPQVVLESGAGDTLQFFRRLKRAIQAIDPRPVSMDSWVPLAFMDHHDFDFAMFNTFAFWPKSINYSLGFAGYNHWLADHFATDRPFIIGETGGYAVSQATETASGGSGGWSEYNQSLKDLDSLRGTVEGHATGACLVSWIDTWHYPRDPDTHDNEPWEWDGILGIPTDSKKDIEGIPRQIYHDLMGYNEAIVLEPKANHIYGIHETVPIHVYTADNVASAHYSLNDGDWQPLEGSDRGWFRGFFKFARLARHRQRLSVEAMDDHGTVVDRKDISFLTGVQPEQVTVKANSAGLSSKSLQFTVRVTDGFHRPLAQRKVYYGFFYPISLRETQGNQLTNNEGEVALTCPLPQQSNDRYLYVSAGTDSPDRVRTGDMQIFTLSR